MFEGRRFKAARWAAWLAAHDIPWPRLASGALALDDDSFRQLARAFPEREIVSIAGIEILKGGGCIHCITQQEPQP